MGKLKFKNVEPVYIDGEDFFYGISEGGWFDPEKFLEEEDAKKVIEAVNLIESYRDQGIQNGVFIDEEE